MAKIVDITEKLDFEGNPKIKVKNTEIEVNADADTMLKVMAILGDKDTPSAKEVMSMYELIFTEKERNKVKKLNLDFKDFTILVYTAINLINGEDEPGEQ